jgi:RpiR family carbohydrate utilization transcriptional regulator
MYNSLSESEKHAADYIIKRPDDVIHYSITEFAIHCGTSESTIYRLCRKIGFDGYQQFKIALARELSVPSEESLPVEKVNSFQDFVKYVIEEDMTLLRETKELLKSDLIQKSVEAILRADRVLLFGVGRSAAIAQDGSLRLSLLGIHASSYSDPHAQVMIASSLTKSDVVIGISHSGVIRDIVKSMEISKNNGATTISITAGINSPITQVSDIVLYCAAGKEQVGGFFDSRVAEFSMVNVLYRALILMKKDKLNPHLTHLYEKILKPKRF